MATQFDECISHSLAENLTQKKLPEDSEYHLLFVDSSVIVCEYAGEGKTEYAVDDKFTRSYAEEEEPEAKVSDLDIFIKAGGTLRDYRIYNVIGFALSSIPFIILCLIWFAIRYFVNGF